VCRQVSWLLLVAVWVTVSAGGLASDTQTVSARQMTPELFAEALEANMRRIVNVKYDAEYATQMDVASYESLVDTVRRGTSQQSGSVSSSPRNIRVAMGVSEAYGEGSRIELKVFDSETEQLLMHRLEVWDGELRKTYQPLEKAGHVWASAPPMDGMRLENLGLYVAGKALDRWVREGQAFLRDNVLTISEGDKVIKAYLDPSKDFWPTRIEAFQSGQVRVRYSEIEVKEFQVGTDSVLYPVAGVVEMFVPPTGLGQEEGGSVCVKARITATSLRFNVPNIKDELTFEFPYGTRVTDHIVDSSYIVGMTGEESVEQAIDTMAGTLSQQLSSERATAVDGAEKQPGELGAVHGQTSGGQEQGRRRPFHPLVVGLGFVVLAVGVGAIVYILSRGRRHEKA